MQRILILLLLALILSACGQKGDLFIEDTSQDSNDLEKSTTKATVTTSKKTKPANNK